MPILNAAERALGVGTPAEALAVLARFRGEDPLHLLLSGHAYYDLGRRDEAETFYRRAFLLDETLRPAGVGLIKVLTEAGRFRDALELCGRIIDVNDAPAPELGLYARVAFELKDFRLASLLAERGLVRFPADPSFRRLDVAVLLERGAFEAAEDGIRSILEREPADALAWRQLAAVRSETREGVDRLAAIEAALLADPFDHDLKRRHILAQFQAGHVGEALAQVRIVLDGAGRVAGSAASSDRSSGGGGSSLRPRKPSVVDSDTANARSAGSGEGSPSAGSGEGSPSAGSGEGSPSGDDLAPGTGEASALAQVPAPAPASESTSEEGRGHPSGARSAPGSGEAKPLSLALGSAWVELGVRVAEAAGESALAGAWLSLVPPAERSETLHLLDARLALRAQDPHGGLRALEHILAAGAATATVHLWAGQLSERLDDAPRAEVYYRQAMQLGGEAGRLSVLHLARLLHRLEQPQRARDLLADYVAQYPEDTSANALLAVIQQGSR